MPLRITDIIDMPELRTRFLAGGQGGERMIRWAHVCELPDPTEWLGEGDLLMTTGIGIPGDPGVQTAYIEKLSSSGLAGVMIGENMQAPEDLSALCAAADALGFPVLLTQYDVPFSSVTRAVIDASRKEEFDRRNAISRLCVSARLAIEGLSLEKLLLRLAEDVRAKLVLLDSQEATRAWLPKGSDIPKKLQEAMKRQPPDASDAQPVIRRYTVDEEEVLATSVPSRRGSILLIRQTENHWLDYSLLYHLAAVLGISIERLHMETERALRIGSQLLDDLLNSRLAPYDMGKQLEQSGLRIESACLAVARPGQQRLTEWGFQFGQIDLPILLRPHGDELIVLLPMEAVSDAQEVLGTHIGFSNAIGNFERLPEGLREARLALVHAGERPVLAYAEIVDKVPWLPDNLDEAARTFQRVLGPLAAYDATHDTPLLHTLEIFLEKNRSWLIAARQLHIHKTSLVYRIRRIESLTGRSLDRTEDVAVLWLAIQAGRLAGLISSGTR